MKSKTGVCKLNFKNIIRREYWLEIESYCGFNLNILVTNIFLTNLPLTVVNDAHINFWLLASADKSVSKVHFFFSKMSSKNFDFPNKVCNWLFSPDQQSRVCLQLSGLVWGVFQFLCLFLCVCWESGLIWANKNRGYLLAQPACFCSN